MTHPILIECCLNTGIDNKGNACKCRYGDNFQLYRNQITSKFQKVSHRFEELELQLHEMKIAIKARDAIIEKLITIIDHKP